MTSDSMLIIRSVLLKFISINIIAAICWPLPLISQDFKAAPFFTACVDITSFCNCKPMVGLWWAYKSGFNTDHSANIVNYSIISCKMFPDSILPQLCFKTSLGSSYTPSW